MSSEQIDSSNANTNPVAATTSDTSGTIATVGKHIFHNENLATKAYLTRKSRNISNGIETSAACSSGRRLIDFYNTTTRPMTVEDFKRKIDAISSSVPVAVPTDPQASNEGIEEEVSESRWDAHVQDTLKRNVDSEIIMNIYSECRDAFKEASKHSASKGWIEEWTSWLKPASTAPQSPPIVTPLKAFDTFLLDQQKTAERKKEIEVFLKSLYDSERSCCARPPA